MASVFPGFEYDIFISYRQKDNKGQRWVTEFVHALKTEIEATFKEDVSVYFDENPHDGLLATHSVEDSLASKLKCLIFIPVISQTYCDPNSYAWKNELLAFKQIASDDSIGLKVQLQNGNVASRILPVRIHELNTEDKQIFESALGPLRSVDFNFQSPGVNRPLVLTDKKEDNQSRYAYRDQVNKVANAAKEIITSLKSGNRTRQSVDAKTMTIPGRDIRRKLSIVAASILLLALAGYGYYFLRKDTLVDVPLEKSIAVLPFENMSGDPTQDYFSEGIAEEILNSLAQLEGLKVVARTSSFQFKGKGADLKEVGEKLGVATILEGSVRKQGDQLRITAQLINVKDGYHLWSQRFDRKVTDVFSIQDEIATTISEKLKVTLLQDRRADPMHMTGNQQAYDAYLKGRYFLNKRGESMLKALEFFKQAVGLDSTFAAAHSGIAASYAIMSFYYMIPSLDGTAEAKKYAATAIRLDPNNAEAYAMLGFMALYGEHEWKKSKLMLEKSIQLNPNYSLARSFYSSYYKFIEGNPSKGAEEARKSIQIDPLYFSGYTNLADALLIMGKYPETLEAYQKGIEVNEKSSVPYTGKADALLVMKRPDEAIATLEQGLPFTGRTQLMLAGLCEAFAEAGKKEEAVKIYNELNEMSRTQYVSPFMLGGVAMAIGKLDEAFDFYDRAFDEKNFGFFTWKNDQWKGLKYRAAFMKDPRYKKLMDKLAFPE